MMLKGVSFCVLCEFCGKTPQLYHKDIFPPTEDTEDTEANATEIIHAFNG